VTADLDLAVKELDDLIRYCEVERNKDGNVPGRGVIRRARNIRKRLTTTRSTEQNRRKRIRERLMKMRAICGEVEGTLSGKLGAACSSYVREGLVVVEDGRYKLPGAQDTPESLAWRQGAEWMRLMAQEAIKEIEDRIGGPKTPNWCRRLVGEVRIFKYNPFKKWDGPVHPPRY